MDEYVAGADGCKGGWVTASALVNRKPLKLEFEVFKSFQDLVERRPPFSLIMIDIPIGLAENTARKCDGEARKLLGCRACTVYSPPLRAVAETPQCLNDYENALKINRKNHLEQKGISKQSFGILPKIAEVARLMTPGLQNRIMETHPEMVFWALNDGKPMSSNKKTKGGQKQRLKILERIFPNLREKMYSKKREFGKKARIDDMIDAGACLATALLFIADKTTKVPKPPEVDRDRKGLRMEINYPCPDIEDLYWSKEAEKRLKTWSRRHAIKHDEAWDKAHLK